MLLKRVDETFGTGPETGGQRTVSETILDQVWITTSGFFDTSAFLAALTAFGTDRILFSVDYPYATNGAGVAFLNNLPVSRPTERESLTETPTLYSVYEALDQGAEPVGP